MGTPTENNDSLMENNNNHETAEDTFDQILHEVGNKGRFQSRFLIIFNLLLVICTTMPYSLPLQILNTPNHWCHVPGRENTNFTLEEWKNITLPKDLDTRQRLSPSKCRMYNATYQEILSGNFDANQTVSCQHGWEYDRTWYTETVPSQENWVCENAIKANNAHYVGKVGDVVGTLIFGQLGDIIGRRPVFHFTLIFLIIGRLLGVFTAHYMYVFLFANFVATMASTAVFQSPLIIAMEVSDENRHAHVAMMQSIGWSLGMCFLPLIAWYLGHWFYFMLVTTLPCILFFLPYKYMIESPRWLASKGKVDKAVKQLEIIAKINKTSVPLDAKIKLRQRKEETVYGVMSLFTSWRLTKNTILVIINWSTVLISYYVIVLNVANLGGNPFLDYFFQALAELPAYLLARYCCDRFGRRITQIVAFFASGFTCIPLAIIIIDPSKQIFTSLLVVMIQFFTSMSFYGSSLIAIEIFPTCLRQSGLAVSIIFSTAIQSVGPYIVLLGTTFDARYPYYIILVLMYIGALAAFLLPETLHQKLPDTLETAHKFGADQSYFSLPKKPKQPTQKEEPLLQKEVNT